MANPTTNYGFVLPTPTDLVTDLPADFDVALQGVDTRLKALQPGTTLGDLVYASATANTNTRLGIGTAGQVLAVSAGVPAWTTTADVTPLTTKGDLFTFTTVDARLAVGNNGETLVADSAATTGLRYQATQAAGKNTIINGGMDNWQRGTSFAFIAGELYTADRFYVYRGGNVLGATLSRQSSGVNFTQYCSRMQRDLSNTSVQPLYANYTMETQDSIGYASQTVTFSFYARSGANYSGGAFLGRALYGTGTNQKVTAFTGAAVITSVSATLTTSFQRFQGTATVNAAATEIGFDFGYTPTGTAGANDYVEFTGVQFEVGSVATAFTRAGGTLQGELAACQRYYYRANYQGLTAYANFGTGAASSTTQVRLDTFFPVSLRVAPTAIDYPTVSTNFNVLKYDDTAASPTAVAIDTNLSSVNVGRANWTVTTSVANVPYYCRGNNAVGAYLGWSAEL